MKEELESVIMKMGFLIEDRNSKLLGIAISHISKNKVNFLKENDLVFDQLEIIVKYINTKNKDLEKKATAMFYCPSPISNLSLEDYYRVIKNMLKERKKDELDNFIEYYYG